MKKSADCAPPQLCRGGKGGGKEIGKRQTEMTEHSKTEGKRQKRRRGGDKLGGDAQRTEANTFEQDTIPVYAELGAPSGRQKVVLSMLQFLISNGGYNVNRSFGD